MKREVTPQKRRGERAVRVRTRAGQSSALVVQLERRKGLEREDKSLFAFQKGTASGEEQGREVSFYSSSLKNRVLLQLGV